MRISRLTVRPTASNRRRTSRLRPSVMTQRYQRFTPSPPPSSRLLNAAVWPSIATPSSNCWRAGASSVPSTRTAYSRSTPKRGCISLLASSPEVVNSSKPSVLMSSRPTDCHLPCCSRGKRRNTVGRCCGSSWLTTSPAGLWYAITRAGNGAMRTRTGLPSTATRSPQETRWPVCAGSPFTVTRWSMIICSRSRREPTPAWASTFCSLGASASGSSTRLAGSCGAASDASLDAVSSASAAPALAPAPSPSESPLPPFVLAAPSGNSMSSTSAEAVSLSKAPDVTVSKSALQSGIANGTCADIGLARGGRSAPDGPGPAGSCAPD